MAMSAGPGGKTSANTTGSVNVEITLGEGIYQLYAASVSHSTLRTAIAASIEHVYKTGDGSTIVTYLASGYVTRTIPLTLDHTVIVQGPGFIRSTCFHPTTMEHVLAIGYRRVTKLQLEYGGPP